MVSAQPPSRHPGGSKVRGALHRMHEATGRQGDSRSEAVSLDGRYRDKIRRNGERSGDRQPPAPERDNLVPGSHQCGRERPTAGNRWKRPPRGFFLFFGPTVWPVGS